MSRKLKFLAVSLLTFFALAGSASAFTWHLSMTVAKQENERFLKETCEEEGECTAYSGYSCRRASESRVDCQGSVFYPIKAGEEEECYFTLHWGVNSSGVVELKNSGHIRCFTLITE